MATSVISLLASVGAVAPYERWDAGTAPALSAAATARVYFDSVSNRLKLSNDGGAYFNIATGSDSPWDRLAPEVFLNVLTDKVVIGTAVHATGRSLSVFATDTNGIQVQAGATTDVAIENRRGAEAFMRLIISIDGKYAVGDGTALADVALLRESANTFSISAGAAGAGGLVPHADNAATATIGTTALRWRTFFAGSRGYAVMGAASDTGAMAALQSGAAGGQLIFGPGGVGLGSAPDCQIKRVLITAVPYIAIDDFATGARTVIPVTDDTGSLGTAANRWAGVNVSQGGHNVYKTVSDTVAEASLTGDAVGGTVLLGPGGAAALDIRFHRIVPLDVNPNVVIDNNASGAVDVIPGADGVGRIGTRNFVGSRKWSEVNATTITSGDVCFTDQTCAVCGNFFEEGDDLVLRVIKIHHEMEGRLTRTVPAHHGCK